MLDRRCSVGQSDAICSDPLSVLLSMISVIDETGSWPISIVKTDMF